MAPAVPKINITNINNGDVLTYPLAIIRGTINTGKAVYISTNKITNDAVECRVINGSFTALYELKAGRNGVRLSTNKDGVHSNEATVLSLFHMPPSNTRPFVRPIYVLASDSNGSFQSPDPDNNMISGLARLRTAMLMIQSATAEMLHAEGLSRRTFAVCETQTHRLRLPLSKLLTMSGNDLHCCINTSLASQPRRSDSIDVAVMSFSRMDATGNVRAHTALGGGSLALFGGASIWTWPASIDEISKRLQDARKFDTRSYFDDSAFRSSRYGRCMVAATTLGALLHELGHCLSLPHPCGRASARGGGIMARGFDDFDRLFVQPANGHSIPFWDRGSAVRLRYHRFLQFDGEREMRQMLAMRRKSLQNATAVMSTPAPAPAGGAQQNGPMFSKTADGRVKCISRTKLGHIGYCKNGDNVAHEEFGDNEPYEFFLPSLTELLAKCETERSADVSLSAIDVNGYITQVRFDDI